MSPIPTVVTIMMTFQRVALWILVPAVPFYLLAERWYYRSLVEMQLSLHHPPGKLVCSTGQYEFLYPAEVHQGPGPKKWSDVQKLPCIYLNYGADGQKHPNKAYENYVAVAGPSGSGGWGCNLDNDDCGEWCVCHDLRQPIPLANSSVDRIHSEDCLEHIHQRYYPDLFEEIYRLLKPGGRARIAVPDYNKPSSVHALRAGYDADVMVHVTITNYALLKSYVENSSFRTADWLMYYDNIVDGTRVSNEFLPPGSSINSHDYPLEFKFRPFNYSLGNVHRTPDVDGRNTILAPLAQVNLIFDLVKG